MESYLQLARFTKAEVQSQEDVPAAGSALSDADGSDTPVSPTLTGGQSREPGGRSAGGRPTLGRHSTTSLTDDTDTILDISAPSPAYDHTGQQAYERACRYFGSPPCSTFCRRLERDTVINLSHYGTGPTGAKTIAVPLTINTCVTTLNLRGNGLTAEGIAHICRMMSENTSVVDLNLAENDLGSAGSVLLARMISTNTTLTSLDISENNFNDKDAFVLAKSIEGHNHLTHLNLSKNHFGVVAGAVFRNMIAENGLLRTFDLSWNEIRMRGATDLAKGLQENIGLKSMNVSWNGFGDAGAVAIAQALKSCPLVELDISSNRVGSEGFLAICQALQTNDDLRTLKLGGNPVPEQTALAALQLLKSCPEMHLETLDLAGNLYGAGFAQQIETVCDVHAAFRCPYGYTDSYGKRRMKRYDAVEEALTSMKTYCVDKSINIVELFSRFDSDGSMSVTHDEFKLGLREAKIPLSDHQIEELIKALDQDGDGEIDFSEMVLGAHSYEAEEDINQTAEVKS